MQGLCEALTTEIAAIKVQYKKPFFSLGGDFNHIDVVTAIADSKTFKPVTTGPTSST